MHEYTVNLHMHSSYSDGNANHPEIGQIAARCGLDVIIVTDHNWWMSGLEQYYYHKDRRVLLLVGEEIHDQTRHPQKNHLLIFGADSELSHLAKNPQHLIDSVAKAGGLSFIAHPVDPQSDTFGEPDLSWVDWNVSRYNGIELWNAMSEFKSLLSNKLSAIFYAFFPSAVAREPFKATIKKWDELLNNGLNVVAIGGSDAHALIGRMGPLKKIIFPYEFHFQAINTHIQTSEPLTGNLEADKEIVLDALKNGRAFIGYDLPAPTRGFKFTAKNDKQRVTIGEKISSINGVTFLINLPHPAECHLIKNGKTIKIWNRQVRNSYATNEPGIYRVEAYRKFRCRRRGWIYSNPIYLY
jgi:hypothetical protein